ncbi:polymorphic toxin-type HINT domain-containing protein [Pseudomonas sp. zfem002]|uniref:polymorphic toxin-type HINT domain-containing protein n=1 Tax=Pseudomonas sp. zfem002 TaxID=3078197 RepID=UPI0029289DED|nr:polymorphic toxin-type HINT domain-containing protein [Pseudomonas sp. zfem002]MDU9393744.1 polymorphic toxin-type HINT domain-containing protein [Pseudomonas sp. zfem002]
MEWQTGFATSLVAAGRAGKISASALAEFKAQQEAAWKGLDGPCCFAAGTLVATPTGDRAIETLKVGDIVWSKPEHGGEPFAAAILQTHERNDQPIYKLTLENTRADGEVKQETLFVTPSHPFYVPAQREFVPMIQLRTGDLLQSLGDGASENTSSRVASVELYQPIGRTYNLTVDIGHTFYVGELKTWVHNTGPCDITGILEGLGRPTSAGGIKVVEGEVGSYGSTAPRSVGDGLTPDHIPSLASVKEALRQMGVELTEADLKALRNNTNCVVVKTCSHMSDSRTYGGRNNQEKIKMDGSDLYKAAEADLNTWQPVWQREGWSASKIEQVRTEVHELNKKLFEEMGVVYEPK